MIRDWENDWKYDFAGDYYYTMLEKGCVVVMVIIDGNDYAYVAEHHWILNAKCNGVVTSNRPNGKGLSLLHEIMQAEEDDIVYRLDISDPCIFDARKSNLTVRKAGV